MTVRSKGLLNLRRARELNDREPPGNLIRSGCARVLVSDLIVEVETMRGALSAIGQNTSGCEPLAAAYARGVLEELEK